MTTPQTPAGWYSDPDGSGGQRYWDGHAWTEHVAPAPQLPPPPPPPPPPPAAPARSSGAHRAPDSGDVPAQPTAPVPFTATSAGAVDDSPPAREPDVEPASSDATSVIPTWAPSDATTVIPTSPPPSSPPPSGPPPSGPPSDGGGPDRPLLMRYLAVCAALLLVLVATVVYAAFFADDGSQTITASNTSAATSSADATTTEETSTETSAATTTEAPPPTETGDPEDGGIAFSVQGFEVGPTVTSVDAPIEKTAVGEYVVVHMTVTNVSDATATFLGTFQKLEAGGTVYSIDDEATFYVGGGVAQLNPGDKVDVAVAFDVPAGTTPEAIELHGEPLSPGLIVPLA